MLCERKRAKVGDPQHQYIRVHLDFNGQAVELASAGFLAIVLEALRQLHGEVGKAIDVVVSSYDEENIEAVLQVPYSSGAKVWTALTLLGAWDNLPCAFRVRKVANTLEDLGSEEV